jgi:hypothetical protein
MMEDVELTEAPPGVLAGAGRATLVMVMGWEDCELALDPDDIDDGDDTTGAD